MSAEPDDGSAHAPRASARPGVPAARGASRAAGPAPGADEGHAGGSAAGRRPEPPTGESDGDAEDGRDAEGHGDGTAGDSGEEGDRAQPLAPAGRAPARGAMTGAPTRGATTGAPTRGAPAPGPESFARAGGPAPAARDLTPGPAHPCGEPAAPPARQGQAPSSRARTGARARTRALTRHRTAAGLTAVAVAAAVTAAVLTTGGGPGAGASAAADAEDRPGSTAPAALDGLPHTAVDVSTGTCGRGWARPRAGTQVFDLHDSGTAAAEVYLSDPATGQVYAEVEGLAPGATRPMPVDLGSGTYAFMCLLHDTDAVRGPSVTVPGTAPRGPAALPVTEHDLIPPTLAYQRWIGGRAAELARDTGVLKADIDRGDLAAARRDWLTAHLVYERMGAAYGTFGDADAAINGVAARTPGAVHDPSFTGFHRIEYGLWHGEPAARLRGPAARLDADVRALRDGWPQRRIDPADLGLRAHEILEDTLQSELTGRTDYGSGTCLATARATIDGTREILARLDALLRPRLPALPRLKAALAAAAAALDAQHHDSAWTPLARLPRARRERIDADFGAALEQLARVAAVFDVRRTA